LGQSRFNCDQSMSAQEIIEELPTLTPAELRRIRTKVEELTQNRSQTEKTLGEALLEFAGTAEGLPADMAENHDHYLYGVPKRGA